MSQMCRESHGISVCVECIWQTHLFQDCQAASVSCQSSLDLRSGWCCADNANDCTWSWPSEKTLNGLEQVCVVAISSLGLQAARNEAREQEVHDLVREMNTGTVANSVLQLRGILCSSQFSPYAHKTKHHKTWIAWGCWEWKAFVLSPRRRMCAGRECSARFKRRLASKAQRIKQTWRLQVFGNLFRLSWIKGVVKWSVSRRRRRKHAQTQSIIHNLMFERSFLLVFIQSGSITAKDEVHGIVNVLWLRKNIYSLMRLSLQTEISGRCKAYLVVTVACCTLPFLVAVGLCLLWFIDAVHLYRIHKWGFCLIRLTVKAYTFHIISWVLHHSGLLWKKHRRRSAGWPQVSSVFFSVPIQSFEQCKM